MMKYTKDDIFICAEFFKRRFPDLKPFSQSWFKWLDRLTNGQFVGMDDKSELIWKELVIDWNLKLFK